MASQTAEIAKEITIAVIQNSKELNYGTSELENVGQNVAVLFKTIHKAVQESMKVQL